MELIKERRISDMHLHEVYFWTDTVLNWKPLLKPDKYKNLIIDTWRKLVKSGHITIYSFVIMPNYLHTVWELNKMYGKDKPHATFNKKTAHDIRIDLKENHPKVIELFKVYESDRSVRIWQRDPMAILMNTKKKVEQKIDYIHWNPVMKGWKLSPTPEDYYWSSASFYATGKSDFDFITDYRDVF